MRKGKLWGYVGMTGGDTTIWLEGMAGIPF